MRFGDVDLVVRVEPCGCETEQRMLACGYVRAADLPILEVGSVVVFCGGCGAVRRIKMTPGVPVLNAEALRSERGEVLEDDEALALLVGVRAFLEAEDADGCMSGYRLPSDGNPFVV